MLIYPDFVRSAPRDYRGLRAPCSRTKRQHRFTHLQLLHLVGVDSSRWHSYGRVHARTGRVQNMPQFLSAYMAALGGDHPTYWLVGYDASKASPRAPRLNVPPLICPTKDKVAAFLAEQSLTPAEVADTLCFEPGNRWWGVSTLSVDPVAWSCLLLACDEHPTLVLRYRRDASGNHTPSGVTDWGAVLHSATEETT